jgi:hypothetical protein
MGRNSLLALALPLTFMSVGTGEAAQPAKAKPAPAPTAPQKPKDDVDDLMSDEASKPAQQGATTDATPQPKTGPTVLLLPFQPIYRSVTQQKIQTANDLLAKELGQKDLVVVRGGIAKGETSAPSIDGAKKLMEQAAKAESDREIAKAIELRKKTIDELEKNAAAVDPDDYVLAHHFLARAYMWAGLDKEANEVLDQAARMRPAMSLEAKEFSRLYRKWFTRAAEHALSDKPGDLLVASALPGAAVTLDGRAMDVAPVLLKKVVAGKHLVGARIEGVPPFAAIVEVKPGTKNQFMANFSNTMGGSAVGTVADAMAQNTIPKKAVESAAQAGKDAGAAFVVIGALAKGEDRFHVHAYVVQVASAKIAPLEVVDFDLDMLTTESDVLRVVQGIFTTVGQFGSKESDVTVIEKRIKAQNTVNEVAAAPSMSADDGQKRDQSGGKKARAVYQPLKGGKVKIKDEEE